MRLYVQSDWAHAGTIQPSERKREAQPAIWTGAARTDRGIRTHKLVSFRWFSSICETDVRRQLQRKAKFILFYSIHFRPCVLINLSDCWLLIFEYFFHHFFLNCMGAAILALSPQELNKAGRRHGSPGQKALSPQCNRRHNTARFCWGLGRLDLGRRGRKWVIEAFAKVRIAQAFDFNFLNIYSMTNQELDLDICPSRHSLSITIDSLTEIIEFVVLLYVIRTFRTLAAAFRAKCCNGDDSQN